MDRKKARNVFIFRIVCILILVLFFVRGCVVPGIKFLRESDVGLNEKELQVKNEKYQNLYLSFLKKGVAQKMKFIDNFNSGTKSNYLVTSYDDTRIFFHKIDVRKKVKLNEFIKLEKRPLGESPNIVYAGSDSFLYSSESFTSVNNLIITFDGNLTSHVNENDSLMSISYLATKSSFRYEANGVTDMVFKSLNDGEPIPINVVVLNKNKYILIIIATSQRRGANLRPSFIREMLNL